MDAHQNKKGLKKRKVFRELVAHKHNYKEAIDKTKHILKSS